jgi:hypothetical protein
MPCNAQRSVCAEHVVLLPPRVLTLAALLRRGTTAGCRLPPLALALTYLGGIFVQYATTAACGNTSSSAAHHLQLLVQLMQTPGYSIATDLVLQQRRAAGPLPPDISGQGYAERDVQVWRCEVVAYSPTCVCAYARCCRHALLNAEHGTAACAPLLARGRRSWRLWSCPARPRWTPSRQRGVTLLLRSRISSRGGGSTRQQWMRSCGSTPLPGGCWSLLTAWRPWRRQWRRPRLQQPPLLQAAAAAGPGAMAWTSMAGSGTARTQRLRKACILSSSNSSSSSEQIQQRTRRLARAENAAVLLSRRARPAGTTAAAALSSSRRTRLMGAQLPAVACRP